jgi:hypothetical protein
MIFLSPSKAFGEEVVKNYLRLKPVVNRFYIRKLAKTPVRELFGLRRKFNLVPYEVREVTNMITQFDLFIVKGIISRTICI